MMNELKEQHIATIKDAAQKLTGAKRRAFQAQVILDYLNGSARRAEAVFGWLLPSVAKCTKTNVLKMYQGQFWANFRRGDAEKGSAPAVDVRPLLAGWGCGPHRPPEYKASC